MQVLKKILLFLKARFAPRGARYTFSTCAEDLIVADILGELGIKKPIYIDIGAHHPVFGNNTYLLYRRGGHGVLVEPNKDLCEKIKNKRPRDVCLNGGAGRNDGEENFYAFSRDTRSTFSKQQAEEWEKASGQKPTIQKQLTFSLNTIVKKYFSNSDIDLVSIDAEGYDVEIISGYNFEKRPKVFCIESIFFGIENPDPRDRQIFDLMKKHEYLLKLQTRNNSIFVDSNLKIKK
ncbi:MAG: FkbM family methyltransferase [Minisyncoccia bacterium]